MTVKEEASGGRALRARRCSQERRQCARCAQVKTASEDRATSERGGVAALADSDGTGVHDCSSALRPNCRRRPYQAGAVSPRSSGLAYQQRPRGARGHSSALLAAYSPELQPCERLWPLTNENVANRSFCTLDDLETAQVERCVVLQNQAERIRSLTHFRLQASFPFKASLIIKN